MLPKRNQLKGQGLRNIKQLQFAPFGRGRGKPTRFKRNRNRNRFSRTSRYRPKYSIVFGQQQDLAFGNNTRNRGMLNTFTTPVSESKMIRSYFQFNKDTITLCQPIPANCYSANIAIIPLHPLFYIGRLSTMSSTFLNFSVVRSVIHYVPLIGSTSTGMIAMTSVQHCNPITSTVGDQFGQITLLDAEINPVWMCSKHIVKDLDNTIKTIIPINRKDIPNLVYVVGSGLVGTLVASATLFLELSIKLSRPAPNNEYIAPGFSTFTISAAGIKSTVAQTYSVIGIVMTSTVTNIDVGEMIIAPPLPVAGTDYTVQLNHNSQTTDYTAVTDQGVLTIQFMALN